MAPGFLRPFLVLLKLGWPADADSLRFAYRKAALEHHPDRGGSASAFLAVKEARDEIERWLSISQPGRSRKATSSSPR